MGGIGDPPHQNHLVQSGFFGNRRNLRARRKNPRRKVEIIAPYWGPPPSKSDKTLYTGIYLPTFREGTNFIIKLLVSCLGALTGPRESPPGIYNGIYTGIYLPTFREGTHFIIKTVSFVSGGSYGPRGVFI